MVSLLALVIALDVLFEAKSQEPLTEYLARRDAFMKEQQSFSSGYLLELSSQEREFDIWLHREVKSIVQQDKRNRLKERFAPAAYFPAVRKMIENTTLYQMLRKMPKGGNLHLHTGSSCSMTAITEEVIDLPGCHVYWDDLNSSQSDYSRGTIAFYNSTEKRPAGFRPVQELLKEVPDFRSKLMDLLLIPSTDAGLPDAQIWVQFYDIFGRFRPALGHRLVFELLMQRTMEELIADNVMYMEIRVTMMHGQPGLRDLDGRHYAAAEVVDIFRHVLLKVQQSVPQFTARIIANSARMIAPEEIGKDLELAFQVKAKHPGMVVGWDAVGEEEPNHRTLDYAAQILNMSNLASIYGTELPMMLHDGEDDWIDNTDVVDAMLLGAKRIGHGFNMNYFPLVEKFVKEQDIAIEVCPISNQVLGYIGDLRLHPAAQWLREGLPVVLASDDPGAWGAKGLSHDFWEAIVAWQLDVRSLKYLAQSSLLHSGLSPSERAAALQVWQQQWDEFMSSWQLNVLSSVLHSKDAPRGISV